MFSASDEIISELSKQLKEKVEEVVDLSESLDKLQVDLEVGKRDVRRLKMALDALTGSDIPIGVDLRESSQGNPVSGASGGGETATISPVRQPDQPAVRRTPQNPCNSCGGEMYYQARTLNNGKVVNLWVCGECSNERF